MLDAKCRAINNKGRVLPPSDEVYQTISKLMTDEGSRITPKHIHTIVSNNRHGFRDYILKTFDIREQELTISINNNDFNVTECVDQSIDTQTSSTSININFVISPEKWHAIRPQKEMYGKRIYWKLRKKWADVVAEAMWVQYHLNCVFVFKNNNVYRSAVAKYFLTFERFCRKCSAKICGNLIKELAKDVDIILKCHIDGIRPKVHSGKV